MRDITQDKDFRGVGIAGFKTKEEIQNTLRSFNDVLDIEIERWRESDYAYEITMPTLMVGIHSSKNRLIDKISTGNRAPCVRDLASLLLFSKKSGTSLEPKTEPVIHYYTKEKETLAEQLGELFGQDDIYFNNLSRTVQLNVDWPDIDQLKKTSASMPYLRYILQLPRRAVENMAVDEVVKRVKDYRQILGRKIESYWQVVPVTTPCVKYVLIDLSGGKGVELDADYTFKLARKLQDSFSSFEDLDFKVGFAGGLEPSNLDGILETANQKLNPTYFIDTESGVRTEDSTSISESKIKRFLTTAIRKYNFTSPQEN